MKKIDVDEILWIVECYCNLDCWYTEIQESLEDLFEHWSLISDEEYNELKEYKNMYESLCK